MEFQTRSEKLGINVYPTLKEALVVAMTEVSIWKISFTISETGERVRLVWDSAGFFRLENIVEMTHDSD